MGILATAAVLLATAGIDPSETSLIDGRGPALGPDSAHASSDHPAPQVGQPAPGFALPYASADTVVFRGEELASALQRGPVVLAFYPADWSPGCTRELCTFRDAFHDLASLEAEIWAISGDYVFSHRAWAEHHGLPFRLLSDHDHAVARAYGSYNPENGFNRRTVFVVGRDGVITYADLEYSVADSADFEALKTALAGLKEKK